MTKRLIVYSTGPSTSPCLRSLTYRPTDPGFRTGVKVAVVDATGKVIATSTIYPHEPQRRWDDAIALLARFTQEHKVELLAIGNGTAWREPVRRADDLIKRHPELKLTKVMVSEAGASVYSASAYASQELPELDVTLRGAVSIARRLQDPLAELVKIDPKSIGVGQYQHDLAETKLSRSLDAVVEDCVNAVGVDLNTASAPLLTPVSGIGESLAAGIVREGAGPNGAGFGAFVDVGVHQDGLVHVSAMSKNFVSDPREVVKPGDIVRVKVLDVDIPRKRISLTLRLDDDAPGNGRQG